MTSEDEFVTTCFLEKYIPRSSKQISHPFKITMLEKASLYPAAPNTVQTFSRVLILSCHQCRRWNTQGSWLTKCKGFKPLQKLTASPSHITPCHPTPPCPTPSNPTLRDRREADVIGKEIQYWIFWKHNLQIHYILFFITWRYFLQITESYKPVVNKIHFCPRD